MPEEVKAVEVAFACGAPAKCPKGGEHDSKGPGLESVEDCPRCEGTGERQEPLDTVDLINRVSKRCGACKGEGKYTSAWSATCSKCGVSAMDVSIWNGP